MSRTYKDSPDNKQFRSGGHSRRRNISVRAVRRDPPDLRRLSRAVIALAVAQAEAEAQAAKAERTTQEAEADPPSEESPSGG